MTAESRLALNHGGDGLGVAVGLLGAGGLHHDAVSYTHLDVYKRQDHKVTVVG